MPPRPSPAPVLAAAVTSPALFPAARIAAVLLVLLAPAAARGQEPPPAVAPPLAVAAAGRKYPPRVYRTVRLEGAPPVIDGRFDEPAWRQGEWAGDYTQQMPVEGAPPTQKTEIKVLFDERHLYVAIRAHDDPSKVHRYPGRRDEFNGYAVDIVGVCFDSYNDKRTGFEFDLTAGGGKIDLLLGNGETEWDTSWDAVWDGRVGHDAGGWNAEFRLPLNQLRFGPQDEQVWGMHAWRWIARNQEEDQWQLIPRHNSGRMHQLGELHGIRGLPRRRHLELLPYALARSASGPSTPGSGADGSGAVGLDVKMGLATNFTLDATVNPDFGQVEADPSVVNLTAYETFYQEKRPFFLEGKKIFSFEIEDRDQLFYSRRVGAAPSYGPELAPGEELRSPASTTILSALKVTGKTNGGLSVGVLQSLTQKETAEIRSPSGARELAVEPFGSYTVARVQKDWDKGNTSLGGMLTQTRRFTDEPALAFLPTSALTGGVDFTRYFGGRKWLLEANGVWSRVSGDPAAILALQTGPVHYYQRPDASHLGVDPSRRSLFGHGGMLRAGSSGTTRLRLTDHFHWYSPGLDLNDVGYLRQADLAANQVFLGWSEPAPKGVFRDYSLRLMREDGWDFGGLHTRAISEIEAEASFKNKWRGHAQLSYHEDVETGALRGGPALRTYDYWTARLGARTDGSRRASLEADGEHSWSVVDDSRVWAGGLEGNLRLSNRLSLSAEAEYERQLVNLQYVASVDSEAGQRWVLGRIDQDTWSFTLRVDLALSPDLTLQYYGSPFLSSGRYSGFKHAADTLARDYERRFHRYGAGEIAYDAPRNAYDVTEAGGARYTFANPDFSFRQFRSNLVARWEYRPGSSLYLVWSQGRTGSSDAWQGAFGRNWDELWRSRSDNVFLVKLSYWFSP